MYTVKNAKLNMKDAEIDIFGNVFSEADNNLISHSHFHQYPEIHIITNGECTIECASQMYKLVKGESCIIPRLLPHKVTSVSADVEKHTFMFLFTRKNHSSAVYNELNNAFGLKCAIVIKNSELSLDLHDVKENIKNENTLNRLKMQHQLALFIISLAEKLIRISEDKKVELGNITDKRIYDIEEYIHVNYNNSGISLTDLSKSINLCERQINRLLQEHCGCSFKELLTQHRMWYARELLSDKTLSLLEISEKLGYSSYSGFFYSAKKFWGVSPQDYRDTLR